MKLFRRGDIKSARVPENFLEKFKRSIVAGISGIAIASAFGLGMPSVAHAEEGAADTNTTPEMTYEMSNDEISEITDGGFSETVTADTVDYGSADYSDSYDYSEEQTTVEESTSAEQAAVEEGASAEQTAVEEGASAEQTTVEEGASAEQTTVEESTSAEQTTVEESTSTSEEQGFSETVEYESSESSSVIPTTGSESSKESEMAESSFEVVETETTSHAAFTVVEKNGKVYVFTEVGKDAETQKLLAEKFNEWWNANYGAQNTPTNIYNIASDGKTTDKALGKGAHSIYYYELVNGEMVKTSDYIDIVIGDDKKVSIVDKDISKVVELNDNLEAVEGTNTKQDSEAEQTEQTDKENTSNDKSTVQEDNDVQKETKSVVINNDDFIIIPGKDGITIAYKYILGKNNANVIRENLIKEGIITNETKVTFGLLPTSAAEGVAHIAGNTIGTSDGVNYIIKGEGASSVIVSSDKDASELLKQAADKSKNGNLDGDKGKPDHKDSDEPTPDTPTPKEPDEPTPDTPTPKEPDKPTPDKPTPNQPTAEKPTSSVRSLPKTGDPSNPLAAGAVALAGIGAIAAGVKRRNDNKYSDKDLDDDSDIDPVLNNTEYQNDVAIVERAKHFSKNQRDRIKDELYKEYSSQIANDSKKGPKHLAK